MIESKISRDFNVFGMFVHFDGESPETPSTLLTGGLYARCDHRYGDNNK